MLPSFSFTIDMTFHNGVHQSFVKKRSEVKSRENRRLTFNTQTHTQQRRNVKDPNHALLVLR